MLEFIPQTVTHANNRIAIIDQNKQYSFGSIQLYSHILAAQINKFNISQDARIGVLLPNSLQAVIAFLAITQTGRSYLPLNVELRRRELETLFRKCNVRLAICNTITELLIPEGIDIVVVDEIICDEKCKTLVTQETQPELAPDRELVCLSTSGSTGNPRIVVRGADAVYANIKRVSEELQITPEDRFLSVVPFWHANGFSNCLLMPLFCGASLVIMDRFLPRIMCDLIQSEKPTIVIGSPFIFRALALILKPDFDLGHVRAWISSGAALQADIDTKLHSQNIYVRQLYGSSETGTISISSDEKISPGNVGKPLPGVKVRLVDEKNKIVQQGRQGEIQVSSTSLFSGYLGESPDDNPMRENGYYCTNDLGIQDKDGSIFLTGRTDAMINIAGVKVDPYEVQRVLISMPGVDQALVFTGEDANGIEIIKVMLVVENSINTEDVLHYCRKRLAEYKLPRTIKFVDEIPQNLMGKNTRALLEN